MFRGTLAHNLRTLMLQAMPELAFLTPRMAEVIAIADPLPDEKATDRFRPRYAVDVRLLTVDGNSDPAGKVYEGLPLPGYACGDGRGIYGFPDPGAKVLIVYAYALPTWPMIVQVYPMGSAVPALQPGELLIQQQFGVFLRFGRQGDVTLQTDGLLREDSHTREIAADSVSEVLGSITRAVDGDVIDTVQGSLDQTILGAVLRKIGGHSRDAILGGEDRTIAGDKQELVANTLTLIAGNGAILRAVVGNILIESIAGNAELKALLEAAVRTALSELAVTDSSVNVN